jgi:N6-adenosine-specific RNA methylase IME4
MMHISSANRNQNGKESNQINLSKYDSGGILSGLYPELPTKKYDVIYANPPWDHDGKIKFYGANEKRQPALALNVLKQIEIQKISKENSLLFMWVTNRNLDQGIDLGKTWGFDYATVAFIWDKIKRDSDLYTMSSCEMCLAFKKGKTNGIKAQHKTGQMIKAMRTEDNLKPVQIRDTIGKMFPLQDKIEIFTKEGAPEWDAWGFDIAAHLRY